jgi:hypothetical protein
MGILPKGGMGVSPMFAVLGNVVRYSGQKARVQRSSAEEKNGWEVPGVWGG